MMFILIEKKSSETQQSVSILGSYETRELAESRAAERKKEETKTVRNFQILFEKYHPGRIPTDDIKTEWFVAPLPEGDLAEVIWPHR